MSEDTISKGLGTGVPPRREGLDPGCDGIRAQRVHVCLSVRGALNWPRPRLRDATKWIKRGDGSAFTMDELRDALMDELAQGHEVIPMAAEPCEGFDYKTGCPGHPCATGRTP